jgi:hypothetical protein
MSEQFTNGYALLISVDENNIADWALPDVVKDVKALEKVLTHKERCAYPPDNVKVLMGKEATRQGILDGLEWLQERIAEDKSDDATVVIYYTGHGWRDESVEPPDFYFIPYDIKKGKERARALRATDFAGEVSALKPERLLVVLDCCHAAGMGVKDLTPLPSGYVGAAVAPSLLMEKGGASVGPAARGAKGIEELTQGKGRAVLSSSTGEQSSWIRQDRQMSVFTYHLIEALTGHAEPEEGAKEVLVSDVMGHVYRHVPKSVAADWGAEQTPDYQVSGNFPIALLLGGKGLSKGQPAPDPLGGVSGEEAGPAGRKVKMKDGVYVEGEVTGDVAGGDIDKRIIHTGSGDFVEGNKIVGGDQVHGDKVMGDKVGGDKISVGDISGSTGIAIGREAQAGVTQPQGLGGDEITRLFRAVYEQIENRSEDPDVDKGELANTVQKIEKEAAKGEEANVKKVERWLTFLADMAPDILKVTAATLANPVVGVATAIRLIAEEAQAQAGSG